MPGCSISFASLKGFCIYLLICLPLERTLLHSFPLQLRCTGAFSGCKLRESKEIPAAPRSRIIRWL